MRYDNYRQYINMILQKNNKLKNTFGSFLQTFTFAKN